MIFHDFPWLCLTNRLEQALEYRTSFFFEKYACRQTLEVRLIRSCKSWMQNQYLQKPWNVNIGMFRFKTHSSTISFQLQGWVNISREPIRWVEGISISQEGGKEGWMGLRNLTWLSVILHVIWRHLTWISAVLNFCILYKGRSVVGCMGRSRYVEG